MRQAGIVPTTVVRKSGTVATTALTTERQWPFGELTNRALIRRNVRVGRSFVDRENSVQESTL